MDLDQLIAAINDDPQADKGLAAAAISFLNDTWAKQAPGVTIFTFTPDIPPETGFKVSAVASSYSIKGMHFVVTN